MTIIGLALAIAGAWLLISLGAFAIGLTLAAFGRWRDERDMMRALRWWESLTPDEQARRHPGPASQADILRVWDDYRLQL